MIHPHIPISPPTLTVKQGPNNLTATLTHEGQSFSFPLPRGHAERALENALLHIASGVHLPHIIEHFHTHNLPESQCPCCKLEGRLLTSQGRRAPSQTDRLIASRASQGGKVEIRHLAPGLTGAQIRALDHKRSLWASKPQYPTPVKSTKRRIEDLI